MMVQVLVKSYQNKWVILGHELTENNVRKERIRSHRSQRHVAVLVCRFLIDSFV
jgi:hypothetical protein